MSVNKIPKILHYCAFGSFVIDEAIISSWQKFCPDYEIICWNEENFDINLNNYVKEAYESQKYAFVSDVARLWALYNVGGIYLDTDVELTNSLDKFLDHELFMGLEAPNRVSTALIGASPNNKIINELLDNYSDINFDLTTNVDRISFYLINKGMKLNGPLEETDGITIYPQDYFSPMDFVTGKINRTVNTHAIHYYKATWKTDEEILRDSLFFKLKRRLPEKLSWNIASYIAVMKFRGLIQGHKDMFALLGGKKNG